MLNQSACFRFLATCAILLAPSAAIADSLFDAQDLDPQQVIAIARPYGGNKYDLLILKQIPGQRQCWQEEGSHPTTVAPLLLNFDFTGICERSTDSNGYSLRVEGQDLGLDYLLRVVERDGELWLVGTHRQNKTDVVIGRTHGIKQGFLKIDLESGWKFATRAYQGRMLGHVYLTGDRAALQATVPSPTTTITRPTPETRQPDPPSLPEPLQEITFTADPVNANPPTSSSIPDRPLNTIPSSRLPAQPTSRSLPPLPVAPQPSPRSLPPAPAVNRNVNGTEPLPSFSELPPLPPPPPATQQPATAGNGRKTLSDILTLSPNASPTSEDNNATSYRVPQPPGLNGGDRSPLAQQNSYRVLVNPGNQQAEVKSRYPDAFVTSYQGRSLLQIGRFSSQENAQKALSELESLGVRGIITR